MSPLNVITVKIGTKYIAADVNRIYTMAKRRITAPFTFYCYTDDNTDLLPGIHTIPFEDHGLDLIVCNKMKLFDVKLTQLQGRNVYFDVDLIVKENLDDIIWDNIDGTLRTVFTHWKDPVPSGPTGFDKVLDYYLTKCYHRINSSVMIWDSGTDVHHIWNDYMVDPEGYMIQYPFGMDAYLFHEQKQRLSFIKRGAVCSHYYGRDIVTDTDQNRNWIDTDVSIILLNGAHEPRVYRHYEQYFS
jgi:hypothetical protein